MEDYPLSILIRHADKFIAENRHNLGALSGNNGPHFDPENPLRNSCHWLTCLCRLVELTGDVQYENAARCLVNYILNEFPCLSAGEMPQVRLKDGKDKVNGVIGAAWIVEGLCTASRVLDYPELDIISARLVDWFPFDSKLNMWITREHDGIAISIDTTLNHQVWFAMACLMVNSLSRNAQDNLSAFLKNLEPHIRPNRDGLFRHTIKSRLVSKSNLVDLAAHIFSSKAAQSIKLLSRLPKLQKLKTIGIMHREKEVGYFIFTLHALTRISASPLGIRHNIRIDAKFINKVLNEKFLGDLSFNRWSYPYNPPGFELPLIFEILNLTEEGLTACHNVYMKQLELTYDWATRSFASGNDDPITLEARLYSLSLCSNYMLNSLRRYS